MDLGTSSGFGLIPFPETQGRPRDYAGFGSVPFSAYRKDGPRATGGFASRAFSSFTKADLGAVLKAVGAFRTTSRRTSGGTFSQIGILSPPSRRTSGVVLNVVTAFRTASRWTSGVSKSRWGVWLPLQTDLVAVLKGDIPFRTTSRRNLGGTVLPQGHFCTPQDRPRGCPKENLSFGYPLQTDLGGC